jgi:hypothetical protein
MGILLNNRLRTRLRHHARQHSTKWRAGVWIAVLLQMHIFLVLQLHQHQTALEPLASTQPNSAHAAPSLYAANLLCPACQIARHGIVHPTGDIIRSGRFLETDRVSALFPARPFLVPFLKLSGRDPPQR